MGTVRCHNPVAADIDVTDNCFCTVFFAGLYLSSSFNKTAIIFHKNNEVFVNCDMYLQCRRFASTHAVQSQERLLRPESSVHYYCDVRVNTASYSVV